MNDYTPTAEELREGYAHDGKALKRRPWDESEADALARRRKQFDRWLAEHDAALVAERDEAIRQRDGWASRMMERAAIEQERDAAREQLAAAEAVIRGALDVTPLGGSVDNLRGVVDEMRRILSGYPVSSALTERGNSDD